MIRDSCTFSQKPRALRMGDAAFLIGGTMELKQLMSREIDAINKLLHAHRVDAGTRPKWTLVAGSSFIAYGVRLGKSERIANVHNRLPEITERISALRGMKTPVRLRHTPLALEVPHPLPQPLRWGSAPIHIPAHHMAAGRRYDYQGPAETVLSLADVPHTLIAGQTNAGKSILLKMMLLTLLYNTSPADLRMVLVDLKNEDLVPFTDLPHVLTFAGKHEEAGQAIEWVLEQQLQRIDAGDIEHPYRIALVIDEMAQAGSIPGAVDHINRITAVGRSKAINVIGATQKPSDKLTKGIDKTNFTLRLVGRMGDANDANVATGRPQTGAEMLPGRGAFLCIDGDRIDRIQSYYIDTGDVYGLVGRIRERWLSTGYDHQSSPVMGPITSHHQSVDPENEKFSITGDDHQSIEFPIGAGRPLTEIEAQTVRTLAASGDFDWRGDLSLSALTKHVYGSKGQDRMQWVKDALGWIDDEKVIKLRRAQ